MWYTIRSLHRVFYFENWTAALCRPVSDHLSRADESGSFCQNRLGAYFKQRRAEGRFWDVLRCVWWNHKHWLERPAWKNLNWGKEVRTRRYIFTPQGNNKKIYFQLFSPFVFLSFTILLIQKMIRSMTQKTWHNPNHEFCDMLHPYLWYVATVLWMSLWGDGA